jgi:outer membrane receptor for ferrienterochelin and colicin
MLKQLIFAVLAILLVSQVEGKRIEHLTFLPDFNWVPAEDTIPDLEIISLRNGEMNLHQIIIPNRKLKQEDKPGTIIDQRNMGTAFLNVFEMIQGRVPGVWVSGSNNNYQVRIRGAMRPPLVVVDGMIFRDFDDQQLNNILGSIPPMDVDYIEVLKSIAQAAIYGPGAGNGVIVVHTKRGGPPEN